MAPQLKRKAVNRPNAEANLLGNLHDACSLPKLGTGASGAQLATIITRGIEGGLDPAATDEDAQIIQ